MGDCPSVSTGNDRTFPTAEVAVSARFPTSAGSVRILFRNMVGTPFGCRPPRPTFRGRESLGQDLHQYQTRVWSYLALFSGMQVLTLFVFPWVYSDPVA